MSVSSRMKEAARTIRQTVTPTASAESRDILDTLRKEHDEVQSLLSELQEAQGAERQTLVQRIKTALVPHTKAEEKVVYSAVIAVKDKEAQADGHEGYLEHELASKTLSRLAGLKPASPEHKAAAKVLKELVDHHVRDEEDHIWKDVEQNFSDQERVRMNREFLAAKKKVRIS